MPSSRVCAGWLARAGHFRPASCVGRRTSCRVVVIYAGDGYGADDAGGAGGRTSRMEEGLLRGRAGGGSINAPNHLATHTTDADATSWKRSRDLYASPVLHADGLEEVRTIVGIA